MLILSLSPASRAAPAPDPGGTSEARRWAGFGVVSLGMLMTFLNITATVSVLATIRQTVHTSSVDLVWIASVYSLLVASLVLSAGTLGDIVGRRAMFTIGTVILGAGSLVCFFADTATVVIVGQAVMGLGGAMILPNSLSIVTNSFTEPHERTAAVSIWTAISGVGLAIGPLVAGALLRSFSWHSVFLVNVALAALTLALTLPLVEESRHPTRRLDPAGLVCGVATIAALNYGVIQGGQDGFGDPVVLAAFAVAVVGAGAFLFAESRAASPMVTLSLFRDRSFATANAVGLVAQYVFVGIALAQVLYFEQIRHDTILATGLKLLPLTAGYVVVSAVAARLVRLVGFTVTIVAGLALAGAGVLLILTQQAGTAYGATAVLVGLIGAGAGLILPPATSIAVLSVPHTEGGMASATVNTFRQVGNTLGASITGTIITSGLSSRLPGELTDRGVPRVASQRIGDAVSDGSGGATIPASLARTVTDSVGAAFTTSLHIAVLVPGAAAVAVLIAAALFIRRPGPKPVAATPTSTHSVPIEEAS